MGKNYGKKFQIYSQTDDYEKTQDSILDFISIGKETMVITTRCYLVITFLL